MSDRTTIGRNASPPPRSPPRKPLFTSNVHSLTAPADADANDPIDMRANSMQVSARLQGVQSSVDSLSQQLRQLRREVDSKQEQSEHMRMQESLSAWGQKISDIQTALDLKASNEDVTKRVQGVVSILGRKADHEDVSERMSRCPTKAELQAELSGKASSTDIKGWLATKADISEVDAMFERQAQNLQGVQLQVDTAVSSEMEARRQALLLLRESLTQEVAAMRDSVETKFARELEGLKRSLQEEFVVKLEAAQQQEERLRGQGMNTLQDALKAEAAAMQKSLQAGLAVEGERRGDLEGALRKSVDHTAEMFMLEVGALRHEKAGAQDVSLKLDDLAELVAGKVEKQDLELMLMNFPTKTDLSAELGKRVHTAEVQGWLESKADRVDVRASLDRQSQACQSLQEKLDSGLTSEMEARRKGDTSVRELVLQEFEKTKGELEMRFETETVHMEQNLKSLRDVVEGGLSEEERKRLQALDDVKQAVKEDFRTFERDLERTLQGESSKLQHIESMLPRFDRQLMGMEEALKLEEDNRNAQINAVQNNIHSVSQDLQALRVDSSSIESRMREDNELQGTKLLLEANKLREEIRSERADHLSSQSELTLMHNQLREQLDELSDTAAGLKTVTIDHSKEIQDIGHKLGLHVEELHMKLDTKAAAQDVQEQFEKYLTMHQFEEVMETRPTIATVKGWLEPKAVAADVESGFDRSRQAIQSMQTLCERTAVAGAEALKAGMQDVRNAAMEELQATRREIDGARKDAVQKLEADAVALRRAAESLRQQMEEGLEKVHKEMEIAMRGETEARGNELKHTRGAVEQVEKDIQVLRTDMLHRDVRHGDALKHSADLLENQLDSGLERVHNSSRQLTEELAKNLDTANTRLEDSINKQGKQTAEALASVRDELEEKIASESKASGNTVKSVQSVLESKIATEVRSLAQAAEVLHAEVESRTRQAAETETRQRQQHKDLEERTSEVEGRMQSHIQLSEDTAALVETKLRNQQQVVQEMHADLESRLRSNGQITEDMRKAQDAKLRALATDIEAVQQELLTKLVEEERTRLQAIREFRQEMENRHSTTDGRQAQAMRAMSGDVENQMTKVESKLEQELGDLIQAERVARKEETEQIMQEIRQAVDSRLASDGLGQRDALEHAIANFDGRAEDLSRELTAKLKESESHLQQQLQQEGQARQQMETLAISDFQKLQEDVVAVKNEVKSEVKDCKETIDELLSIVKHKASAQDMMDRFEELQHEIDQKQSKVACKLHCPDLLQHICKLFCYIAWHVQ
ncbi:hypothetical protein CYMTET_3426 [Cymbomonas tetramitiformis]|uniref:Uncharacterized protein n=1 Tax=Cymbomonas tetramitiformis TaxID=36881 RepID=A0AAE0H351_9CHLO|nr:hypothetical protein CYMTET_3426 [Cymbomonas tetramitiformis]